jgi:hypothetical protein
VNQCHIITIPGFQARNLPVPDARTIAVTKLYALLAQVKESDNYSCLTTRAGSAPMCDRWWRGQKMPWIHQQSCRALQAVIRLVK